MLVTRLILGCLIAALASGVEIDSGKLAGTRFGGGPDEMAFLGIPFAAAPVGDLRWRPPQLSTHWTGIRQAQHFAPACPQLPSAWWPEMAGRDRLETSEDCLYLNLWTTNLSANRLQPVMVWIHGGGNVEGSSQIPPLAPALARKGVVVVSLEYRLGVLGFLAHPALTAESSHRSSGNYGLLDQIAALQWIRRNIQSFGGDPAKVTIFGESSGAEDVCHLMASPLAAGLFQRAILQSGFCLDSVYPTLPSSEAQGARLAHGQTIQALRLLKADDLIVQADKLPHADFGAIVDGWVVPRQPALTYAQGKQSHVPVLVGSNANETTVFGKTSPMAAENSRPKTIASYRAWLRNEFGNFADKVWRVYPAQADSAVPAVFIRLQTDYHFGFGARRMAVEMARAGASAYLYDFTKVGRGPFAPLGAFHSEELMFIGNTYWRSWRPDDSDRKLAETMSSYWTNFAKTGNPNGGSLPRWPQFEEHDQQAMQLGDEVKARATPNLAGYAIFEKILQARLKHATH
ncbi:MAG: carboxylesterase family protein [Acidobacteriota bacterium]|nr:carboxylesterase family protein [Acidobacteriota bacterium]